MNAVLKTTECSRIRMQYRVGTLNNIKGSSESKLLYLNFSSTRVSTNTIRVGLYCDMISCVFQILKLITFLNVSGYLFYI